LQHNLPAFLSDLNSIDSGAEFEITPDNNGDKKLKISGNEWRLPRHWDDR